MAASLGRSLVKSKQKKAAQSREHYQAILALETRRQDDEAQAKAKSLKSIWQTNNLEDVLAEAIEKEEGFVEERSVRVVTKNTVLALKDGKVVPTLDADDVDVEQEDTNTIKGKKLPPCSTKWSALSGALDIPHRPQWNKHTSAMELSDAEKAGFARWRRQLAAVEEAEQVTMTPYEKNLEVWRQLWRVVERSDVLLQVVDARNPLTFRSVGFERYVAQHKWFHSASSKKKKEHPYTPVRWFDGAIPTAKKCILLLNKADLLTEDQRKAWAEALSSAGIDFIFFSAKPQEATPVVEGHGDGEDDNTGDINFDDSDDSEVEHAEKELLQDSGKKNAQQTTKVRRRVGRRLRGSAVEVSSVEYFKSVQAKQKRNNDGETTHGKTIIEEDDLERLDPALLAALPAADVQRRINAARARKARVEAAEVAEAERDQRAKERFRSHQSWEILSATALLDYLSTLRNTQEKRLEGKPLMLGLVGYPNVGKSSTINAILEHKKVVVSSTPGKTKHFQTLEIPDERRLQLCDCPGLVFPSFAATKESMVCDGILPTDTVRDYHAAIALLCKRIPTTVFELFFHINISDFSIDTDESASRAEFLLNQISRQKSFMTEHDKPNRARSAKLLLKLYTNGDLVYVHPPPGWTSQEKLSGGGGSGGLTVAALAAQDDKQKSSQNSKIEAANAGTGSEWEDASDVEEGDEAPETKVTFAEEDNNHDANDDDEGWEDATDEDDWEDAESIGSADRRRNLDGDDRRRNGEDEIDEELQRLADPILRARFFHSISNAPIMLRTKLLSQKLGKSVKADDADTRLTRAEQFNMHNLGATKLVEEEIAEGLRVEKERGEQIRNEQAAIDAWLPPAPAQMYVADDGALELDIDEDDGIVMSSGAMAAAATKKQQQQQQQQAGNGGNMAGAMAGKSKKQLRREAKKGGMSLKSAKHGEVRVAQHAIANKPSLASLMHKGDQ